MSSTAESIKALLLSAKPMVSFVKSLSVVDAVGTTSSSSSPLSQKMMLEQLSKTLHIMHCQSTTILTTSPMIVHPLYQLDLLQAWHHMVPQLLRRSVQSLALSFSHNNNNNDKALEVWNALDELFALLHTQISMYRHELEQHVMYAIPLVTTTTDSGPPEHETKESSTTAVIHDENVNPIPAAAAAQQPSKTTTVKRSNKQLNRQNCLTKAKLSSSSSS